MFTIDRKGNLALSRAIGDFEFKQNYALPPEEQVVTVNPEIIVHDVTPEDEFLVIACDGECGGTDPWDMTLTEFVKAFGTACRLRTW